MKKITILLICFFSLVSKCSEASFHKDTLILFAQHTATDSFEVYLVVKGHFGSNCNLDCSHIDILQDTIDIKLGYYVGNSLVTCPRNDTFLLGKFYPHLIKAKLTIGDGVIVNCDSFYRKQQYTVSLLLQNTAVTEIERQKLALSPNPTSGRLNISLTEVSPHSQIEILSISGVSLYTVACNNATNFEIDVSAMPAGIYFLHLSDERQRVVRKFVKY